MFAFKLTSCIPFWPDQNLSHSIGRKALSPGLVLLVLACTVHPFALVASGTGGNEEPTTVTAEIQPGEPGPRFVPNQGQWQGPFQFRADLPDGALFVTGNGLTWSFLDPSDLEAIEEIKQSGISGPPGGFQVAGHAFRTVFMGANPLNPQPAVAPETHYRNYFLGNDPAQWKGRVPEYAALRTTELYPGIDLLLYAHQGALKYDFELRPGARPERIVMSYEGLNSVSIQDGHLILRHGAGVLKEALPLAYQDIKGERRPVACQFVQRNGGIGFEFPERYDTRYPLVIDPVLVFATFSGSSSDNWGYSATYDATGHLYGGGIAFGVGYPTTVGAFQTSFGGGSGGLGCDIALTKYSPDGSSQIWSTYLGGSSNEFPQSLIVNDANELFVYGSTASSNFPITAGCYDPSFNGGSLVSVTSVEFTGGSDIYVARLSADGSALLGSTFVGGSGNDGLNVAADLHYNYGDHARGEIILDLDGGPIVASSTYSSNFPVTPGAVQGSLGGNQDGVLFHLNASLGSLLWSTYIGGSLADGAYSVKIHEPSDNLMVSGGTKSTNFPTTPGVLHTTYQGGTTDGWVMRLNGDATTIVASTYLGTSAYDQAYFVERDLDGEVYVMGQTRGAYPVSAGVYGVPGSSQFIHKLNPGLTATVYSTVFGTGSSTVNISPTALLVDICEHVYVSGWGGLVNTGFNPAVGSMVGLPLSADAFQTTTDGSDFYFFVLAKNGLSLLYASYFGGGTTSGIVSREHVDGGTSRFDEQGVIYQAVCAGCGGLDAFPTTPGAWSETNESSNCNLGTLKFRFDLSGVEALSDAEPDLTGCAPFTVNFDNTSVGAVDYLWIFGDGDSSTDFEPSHVFVDVGIYTVLLIASDTNSCNLADTSYLTIIAGLDSIIAAFDYEEFTNCDTLWASFSNLSQTLGATTQSFWDMGDGTLLIDPGDFTHVYTTPGTYTVTLIIRDSLSCNQADTTTILLTYATSFSSGFSVDYFNCLPVTANFTNDYPDAELYEWDFGDGTTASGLNPIHTYTTGGNYTVTLTTTNCGASETISEVIDVPLDPIAFFDDEPYAAIINTPVTFTNLSQFANSYLWEFSDGSTTAAVNAVHSFSASGTFTVCLTARNAFGCEDEYCRTIDIEFDGFIDVPTAFTPNGDGVNDRFLVEGFGSDDFLLRIFNRWGEMVYEGTDQSEGWDGTFRSKPQEMDVYAWTLRVRFANNRLEERQGNLTLIR